MIGIINRKFKVQDVLKIDTILFTIIFNLLYGLNNNFNYADLKYLVLVKNFDSIL